MNELEGIVARTRTELAGRAGAVPVAELDRLGRERRDFRSFAEALAGPGLSLIAEHKRRSPSAGAIREDLALEDVVAAYERGGASALSILTEQSSFGGSLQDLCSARRATRLPVLRKDFIVDGYQLYEALAAGADAILLIVAALTVRELSELLAQAAVLGLEALVEVHDERELDLAIAGDARLIGINNRNLATLAVDTARTYELAPRVPAGRTIVAESGFSSRDELDRLAQAGVHAVLIGEALMRSPDIEAACRALTER